MISRLGEKLQSLVFCINRWIRNSLNNSDLDLGQKSMNIFSKFETERRHFQTRKKIKSHRNLQVQIDKAKLF